MDGCQNFLQVVPSPGAGIGIPWSASEDQVCTLVSIGYLMHLVDAVGLVLVSLCFSLSALI